jgi:hypothetical protein
MKQLTKYRGIAGFEGREQSGGCLTIGRKHTEKGFPTDKDRFWITNPRETDGIKQLHPKFTKFNEAKRELRLSISGNLVHATEQECFEYNRNAQVLDKAHPFKLPCCSGDGIRASRWMGGDPSNFKDIECPGDKCEFAMGDNPKCRVWMRFMFRVRWRDNSEMPAMVLKYASKGKNTLANFIGFFKSIHRDARNLGLKDYTLFGFPFIMTVADQTNSVKKTRYPVVTITSDMDTIEFFTMQREKIRQLSVSVPIALIEAPEQEPEVIYEDMKSVSIPSNFVPAKDAAPVQITKPAKNGKASAKAAKAEKKAVDNGNGGASDDRALVLSKVKTLLKKQDNKKLNAIFERFKVPLGDCISAKELPDKFLDGDLSAIVEMIDE